MNNDSNNPNKPRKKREPHKGDKARFKPKRLPGIRYGLYNNKYIHKAIIRQNLNGYRFSYYQAAILRKLYILNKETPKMYITEGGLISSTQKYFNLMNFHKIAKKKSVQSAISALNKKNQIIALFLDYDTDKGKVKLLSYHIASITDEMTKQIKVITELIQKNPNRDMG
jgi:hypothetical protein